MYLTVCQQLKHLSKDEFLILRELCRTAKNLTNQAIYQVRQHYFEHSRYLPYEKNYAILKTSENYRLLNSNMAQQILKDCLLYTSELPEEPVPENPHLQTV